MRNKSLISMIAVTAAASLISNLRAAETSADETAIRQSATAFVDAYNKGDAKAVAALWTPDGEYVIGRDSAKGRDAIAKLYGDFFQTHPGSKMEVKIDSIRMIAPTVAIEEGTASTIGSPNSPSTSSGYTATHVKQSGKWLMAIVRESETPAITAGAELGELAWLVGTWAAAGDATKVEMKYEWMADKHFIRGETVVTEKGKSKPGGTEIIGRDPTSGQIISWFFSSNGGHGYGEWVQQGPRWIIGTVGMLADGTPTSATNVLYQADDNVTSWQSSERVRGTMQLPGAKEVVLERVKSGN